MSKQSFKKVFKKGDHAKLMSKNKVKENVKKQVIFSLTECKISIRESVFTMGDWSVA